MHVKYYELNEDFICFNVMLMEVECYICNFEYDIKEYFISFNDL